MSYMKTIAIEAANGDIPTVRQALRDLIDASYIETSLGGRWKESGPDRCRLCGATRADPLKPHAPNCEVGLAEKALIVDVGDDRPTLLGFPIVTHGTCDDPDCAICTAPHGPIVFGRPKEYSIEVKCSCGEKHRLPLDASGHFSGSLPCDPSKHAELQIDPESWRETQMREQSKVKH